MQKHQNAASGKVCSQPQFFESHEVRTNKMNVFSTNHELLASKPVTHLARLREAARLDRHHDLPPFYGILIFAILESLLRLFLRVSICHLT